MYSMCLPIIIKSNVLCTVICYHILVILSCMSNSQFWPLMAGPTSVYSIIKMLKVLAVCLHFFNCWSDSWHVLLLSGTPSSNAACYTSLNSY